MNNKIYNAEFHEDRDVVTRHSAAAVLKILNDIYNFNSCIDVGGGIGVWVDEFLKLKDNPDEYIANCVDGDYITENILVINKNRFIKRDLENRLLLNDKYDLVLSLEVAEHLSLERSSSFINDLVTLGDVVVFSAATIGHTGVGHINEQRMKFWVDLFKQCNYRVFDVVRPFIQDDDKIPWWYKQNIMVYINEQRKDLIKIFSNIKTPALVHMVWDERFLNYKKTQDENIIKHIIEKIKKYLYI